MIEWMIVVMEAVADISSVYDSWPSELMQLIMNLPPRGALDLCRASGRTTLIYEALEYMIGTILDTDLPLMSFLTVIS